jgi:16S rRNA (uracil1498-N3)-methyltransferase
MARFFVRPEAIDGGRVRFDALEARHLGRVLRLGPGDIVLAIDGQGRQLTVRLLDVGARAAEGVILEDEALDTESALDLTLGQSIPKGDRMETVIRMATELGVRRVVPLVTARTVMRVEGEGHDERLRRWRRIAREAAKQCGRAAIPEVSPPAALAAWLAGLRGEGLLVCLWEGERVGIAERLPEPPVTRATLVIGPEGGLAPEEVDALRGAGAVVGGLGPRILRTDTAGPVGVALLQARYGDLLSGAARQSPSP